MIYLFTGTDTDKARVKAFEWVAKARAKEPNLAYARLAHEELSDAALEDAAHSGGLFVKRLLILIDDPYQRASAANDDEGEAEEGSTNVFDDHLDALAGSENAIIILAPKLPTSKRKRIAAKTKVIYEYDAPVRDVVARGFNANLVNALAACDRARLWLEVNRALRAGAAPEMIHGLLHWKARDLMEKGGAKWPLPLARKLSLDLISLLQSSRAKGLDLAESLERFALSV